MSVQQHNLEDFVAGDSQNIAIEFQRDGQSLDLTGWKLWITLKYSAHQTDSEAVLQKVFEVSGAETVIYLSPEETRPLLPANYMFDIQMTSPDQQQVLTLILGQVRVLQGVTGTTGD